MSFKLNVLYSDLGSRKNCPRWTSDAAKAELRARLYSDTYDGSVVGVRSRVLERTQPPGDQRPALP